MSPVEEQLLNYSFLPLQGNQTKLITGKPTRVKGRAQVTKFSGEDFILVSSEVLSVLFSVPEIVVIIAELIIIINYKRN